MSNPARPVAAALRDSPAAAALLARWETSQALTRVLLPLARSIAPGLMLGPGHCDLCDGVLWITVESAAESAKLRQAAPRLVAALVAHGFQVYEMKLRIQAGGTPYPGQGTAMASSSELQYPRVSNRGIGAIETAARALPDSALRRALRRLAETLSRRRQP
jgi:hypothetical protein